MSATVDSYGLVSHGTDQVRHVLQTPGERFRIRRVTGSGEDSSLGEMTILQPVVNPSYKTAKIKSPVPAKAIAPEKHITKRLAPVERIPPYQNTTAHKKSASQANTKIRRSNATRKVAATYKIRARPRRKMTVHKGYHRDRTSAHRRGHGDFDRQFAPSSVANKRRSVSRPRSFATVSSVSTGPQRHSMVSVFSNRPSRVNSRRPPARPVNLDKPLPRIPAGPKPKKHRKKRKHRKQKNGIVQKLSKGFQAIVRVLCGKKFGKKAERW